MSHKPKENAAPTGMGSGANSIFEAAKLHLTSSRNDCIEAIYFWNPKSQSVEPLRIHNGWASK